MSKIPGLGDIPLLGKLFQSRSLQKNNTELLVLVTPELVKPIPAGAKAPEVQMPKPFMKGTAPAAPQNPVDPAGKLPTVTSLPIETLKGWSEPEPIYAPPNDPMQGPANGIRPLLDMTPPPPSGQPTGPGKK